MTSLAIFDFDRTIVDDDSDATIINRLREEKPPPEWDAANHDWTPYMSDVFEHAYSAGLHPSDILDSISSMRPTPGIEELILTLAKHGWDVLILTDANSVFVNHWIKTHGLQEAVTSVITNRAFWKHDRLYIEPCMRQSSCPRCPTNLCKSLALAQWCGGSAGTEGRGESEGCGGSEGRGGRHYSRVVYSGDGRNDYCPATNLPSTATVFPRRGYPMHELIKATLASPEPRVRARVVPWDDAYTILTDIFPDKQ